MHSEPGGCALVPRRIAYLALSAVTAALLLYIVLLAVWTRGLLEHLLDGRSRDLPTRVILKSSVSDEQARELADRIRTASPSLDIAVIGRSEARALLSLQEPWMKSLPDVEVAELPPLLEIRHPDAITSPGALLNMQEMLRAAPETDFIMFNDYMFDRLHTFAVAARGYGSTIVFGIAAACCALYIVFNLAAGGIKGVHRIGTGIVLALAISLLACGAAYLLLLATGHFAAREFGAAAPSRLGAILLAMAVAAVLIFLLELRRARTPRIRVRRRVGSMWVGTAIPACLVAIVLAAAVKPSPKPNFYSEKQTSASPPESKSPQASPPKPSGTPGIKSARSTPRSGRGNVKARAPEPEPPGREGPLPADPYGLAAIVNQRVDLVRFIPAPEEQKRFREAALQRKCDALSRGLDQVEQIVKRRENNMRAAARAVFLLRLANQAPAYLGSDPSLSHLLALRATLEQDARNRDDTLRDFSHARDALNAAAEELAEPQNSISLAITPPATFSHQMSELAELATDELLRSVALTPSEIEAIDACHRWRRHSSLRDHLASLAPEPPAAVPMDELIASDLGGSRRNPAPPKLEPPGAGPGEYIHARTGMSVLAPAAGRVVFAGPSRAGNVVMIAHDGKLTSVITDLNDLTVSPNQRVEKGEKLGEISSSSMIYYELRRDKTGVPPKNLLGDADLAHSLGLK